MRNRNTVAILLFLFALAAGCSRAVTVQVSDPPARPASTPNPQLQKQIEQIAATAKGHVGVLAVVLETGEMVSLNSKDHFPMQSVYKLPICMAVMQQVDAGKLTLDQKIKVTKGDFIGPDAHSPIRDANPNGVELTVRELVRFAIVESDGTASDVLMTVAGGPAVIQKYLSDLNINEIIVLNKEKELAEDWQVQYRNWASPVGAVSLLRALHNRNGLAESSQSLLLKFMIESTPGPKRLKGLLPVGTDVAHKTGTSGSRSGVTAATNDIGIITLPSGRKVAIAVFVSDSPANVTTREGVIAKVAKAVWDAWVP
jgi:beta-lactamase class A